MTDLERIANAKWRTAFLKKIEMLDGFHQLVEHSRSPDQPELTAMRIGSHAAQILAQYTKEELHVARLLDSALGMNAVLDSLYGRLTLIAQSFHETSVILYQMFLARERQAASATWDSYKIHVFLDTFMYRLNHGSTRTSRFDLIFFANNRLELIVWLDSSLKAGKPRSLKQAEMFLNNQTKHYLGLSQRITLEENEVLNCHRELLHYDEIQNVVRLGNIPPEILEKCRKPIQDMGITSLGCPFARAKGVKINALTEIYQYSDQLFLRILEASWEFKRLFNQEEPA